MRDRREMGKGRGKRRGRGWEGREWGRGLEG